MMPNDPAPEWLCAASNPATSPDVWRERIDLTGTGRLTGTWQRECDALRITLTAPGAPQWSLRCHATESAGKDQAPFTCTSIAGEWSESDDFAVEGRLLLDAQSGLRVRVRVPGFGASRQVEITRPR